jgi:hypothetical protein
MWPRSCCQCRGRIPGDRRSVISGSVRLNASTASRAQPHTGQALQSLPSLVRALLMRAAKSSRSSTWFGLVGLD